MRQQRVKEKVSVFDRFGRKLFTVDKWIFDVMVQTGDFGRWFPDEQR